MSKIRIAGLIGDDWSVPTNREVWWNPHWRGEEADRYRNVVKDYGKFDWGNIWDDYSEEDKKIRKQYLNPYNIIAMRIDNKYGKVTSNRSWIEKQLLECEDVCKRVEELKLELSEQAKSDNEERIYYANEYLKEIYEMEKDGRL